MLIAMAVLPGSGKSTLTACLEEQLGAQAPLQQQSLAFVV